MRRRPARRQPGADRADEPGPQARDVRAAGADGLQGDRGRLPVGVADGLRLRPDAHRGGPHPGRRRHPGADPGARAPDRADVRGDRGRQAGDRAPVQLDVDAAARGRVPLRRGRHRRHRGVGRPVLPQVRGARPGHGRVLRVLAGVLHRHRAGVRAADLQRGAGGAGADAGPQGDHQPAGHRRDGDAERVRRLDRVDEPQPALPRERRPVAAPAQRPRHGRRGRGAGLPGRRRPHRGLPVRQRRAHRATSAW